jgi:hypothetical protein
MKKRGVISRKEELIEIIRPLAVVSKHLTELGEKIKQTELTPYYRRGMLAGVKDINNKKYRLKRLGIALDLVQELTLEEIRLRELKKINRTNEKMRK